MALDMLAAVSVDADGMSGKGGGAGAGAGAGLSDTPVEQLKAVLTALRNQPGFSPLSMDSLTDILSSQGLSISPGLVAMMESNPRITVVDGLYKYKPQLDVKDRDEIQRLLSQYLEAGVPRGKLEDAYDGVLADIDDMKERGDVMYVSVPGYSKTAGFTDVLYQRRDPMLIPVTPSVRVVKGSRMVHTSADLRPHFFRGDIIVINGVPYRVSTAVKATARVASIKAAAATAKKKTTISLADPVAAKFWETAGRGAMSFPLDHLVPSLSSFAKAASVDLGVTSSQLTTVCRVYIALDSATVHIGAFQAFIDAFGGTFADAFMSAWGYHSSGGSADAHYSSKQKRTALCGAGWSAAVTVEHGVTGLQNAYKYDFTDSVLPLDREYSGESAAGVVVFRHGCTAEVRELWREAVLPNSATPPKPIHAQSSHIKFTPPFPDNHSALSRELRRLGIKSLAKAGAMRVDKKFKASKKGAGRKRRRASGRARANRHLTGERAAALAEARRENDRDRGYR